MGERDDPDHGVTATLASARRRLADDEGDAVMRQVRNVGISAWTVIGVGMLAVAVLGAVASLSELVLPLVLAVVIGASAYPAAAALQRRGVPRGLAAALVLAAAIVGILALTWVVVTTVVEEAVALSASVDAALAEAEDPAAAAGIDADTLARGREAVTALGPLVAEGLLTALVGGLDAVIGFVGGTVLAALILYYVLKDGPAIRDRGIALAPSHLQQEAEDFVASAVRSLRAYWRGRSALSACITAVVVVACLALRLPLVAMIAAVTFVGGFVPYIGAFVGGALATIVALGERGFVIALVLLGIIVFANVVLENLLEPRIMSGHLEIHPLLVLIATTAGGVLGGIVGLVLAVPLTVIAMDLAKRIGRVAREAREG